MRKTSASTSQFTMSTFDDIKRKYIISSKTEIDGVAAPSITHTRIGGTNEKGVKIHGGKFHIGDTDEFYRAYIDHVLLNGHEEYLTEKQLTNSEDAPVLVDLDFRYPLDTKMRLYTEEILVNVVEGYLEQLKRIVMFEDGQSFPLFLFERSSMYMKYKDGELNAVKDGIHIVIGLKMPRSCQQLLRKYMMEYCREEKVFETLNLVNELSDVFDQTISAGTTGWQLYGSQKPGCKPYTLTRLWKMTFDGRDCQFMMDEQDVANFLAPPQIYENFPLLTARYPHNLKVKIADKATKEASALSGGRGRKMLPSSSSSSLAGKRNASSSTLLSVGGGSSVSQLSLSRHNSRYLPHFTETDYERITCEEELNEAIDGFLNTLAPEDYQIRDAHFIAQMLPEKYYKDGESHLENRLVAFALKHTSPDLFLSWIKLRSKSEGFSFDDIMDLYKKWVRYFNVRGGGENAEGCHYATLGSLKYWAKRDAPQEYQEYMQTSLELMIEDVINYYTDGKIARIMKYLFGDEYVCTNLDKKEIYHFANHHWIEDNGRTLRKKISDQVLGLFQKKLEDAFNLQRELNRTALDDDEDVAPDAVAAPPVKKGEEDPKARIKTRIAKLTEICSKLDNSNPKNNSYNEALELLYDEKFKPMVDSSPVNRWLLCFNNGVLDLKNKIFREGQPTDYISKSTNIDYIPLSEYKQTHSDVIAKLETFMKQLFPIPSLEKYMWDHLSSVLIGEQVEQVFNIYVGSGSNGKSMLTDHLMPACLGSYMSKPNVALITNKRTGADAASPATMALRGSRYGVFPEPEKGSQISDGIIKEYTGEKTLRGRQLFGNLEEFDNQVSLAVALNDLLDVKDCSDGMWRRVKVVKFMSKFAYPGEKFTDNTPFVFEKDNSLGEKLVKWAPVFMSMLVERAFENQGRVKDCPEVIAETLTYRSAQDVLQSFVTTKIQRCEKGQIGQQNLYRTFREWFNSIHSGEKMPRTLDLEKLMNNTFGDRTLQPNKKWNGVMIVVEQDDEEQPNGEI